MQVGINYPWLNYGWDFGSPVPGWGPRAAWKAVLPADLERLARVGVRVVRWFIFGDGIALGTGEHAPRRDLSGRFRVHDVQPLDASLEDDFAALLAAFARADMQLLPSLLGFSFTFPGLDRHTTRASTLRTWSATPASAARIPAGYVKGGRGDVLREPRLRSRFFQHVLTPLLELARDTPRAIHSWELINEPEWITRTRLAERLRPRARSVPLAALAAFVREGASLVHRHGFQSSVGFAHVDTPDRWERKVGALGLSLNQVHFYPRPAQHLPDARFSNGRPAILGEFATRVSPPDGQGVAARPWSELEAAQDVCARLARARARGYTLALPWSLRAHDPATSEDREALLRGIARFTGGMEGEER